MYNSNYTFRQFTKGYNHTRSYSVSSWLICSGLSTPKIIVLSKLYSFSYQSNSFFSSKSSSHSYKGSPLFLHLQL